MRQCSRYRISSSAITACEGYRTLWLPAPIPPLSRRNPRWKTDIYKKEKKTRHDLGREELLKRIDAFTDESKKIIIEQVQKMGSSLDWSRYAYTMDEKRYAAVMEAFVRMYEAGLIYRGDRIVNWDPKLQTTVRRRNRVGRADDTILLSEVRPLHHRYRAARDEIRRQVCGNASRRRALARNIPTGKRSSLNGSTALSRRPSSKTLPWTWNSVRV